MTIVAECACCQTTYSEDGWKALSYVGISHVEADNYGPAETYELRNCDCGSTITAELVQGKLIARRNRVK